MNYFKLLQEFYIRQSVNPLSAGQIALWHGLVHQCNQLGWPREFNMPNRTLEMLTGLSRQGIVKARNALKQAGLIDYSTNGVKATTYLVTDIGKDTSTSDSRQPSGQHSRQPSLQGSRQQGRQHSSTYLRLDKTRLDKTKPTDSQSANWVKSHELWEQLWGFPNAIARQDLLEWTNQFGDDLVAYVIRYAGTSNVPANKADRYLDRVLTHYEEADITTVEQAKAESKAHEQQGKAEAAQRARPRYGKQPRVEQVPEWDKPGYEAPKRVLTDAEQAQLNDRIAALSMPKEEAK